MDMRTWRESRGRADNATKALREALAALGLPERVQQHLRSVVTHSGTPLVHVGMLKAEYVEQIAEALRVAAEAGSLTAPTSQETGS
ncbi:hypothetical protein FNH04_18895 [Streptomyces phyllanthi]|uniref:Uncharacterized protein n=1 Tax=Streptomyces phyllanthi TaxID=1803180 RepID=A0A5N8W326_9ACTN|nr:hypothetical protein [Streptomyces phyllanthi]